LTQASKPSVIRIRIEGLRAEGFSRLLQSVLNESANDLEAGAMISVTDFQIRVRRLPVT
jgi:predicted nuclease of predicted toxin-antitoxin system